MKLIKKHWALLGLITAFILDHSYDILQNTGLTTMQIDLIKALGVIIVGYFWNPNPTKAA